MKERQIVAIDVGSSNVVIAVGAIEDDGRVNIQGIVSEPIEGIDEKSNVLQWLTEDGTKVSVRPSGTEPKIKFYFGVKAKLESVEKFDETLAALDKKLEDIAKELKL